MLICNRRDGSPGAVTALASTPSTVSAGVERARRFANAIGLGSAMIGAVQRFVQPLVGPAQPFGKHMLVRHQRALRGEAIGAVGLLAERVDRCCTLWGVWMVDVILCAVPAPPRWQFHRHDVELLVLERRHRVRFVLPCRERSLQPSGVVALWIVLAEM